MHFKYPELFWALFVLLIPIIIHLFQLRRFKKTPFTNVRLLQKVQSESRKSSTLKKWLLLCTRLLLLAAMIMAFAQPFFTAINALKVYETVIYLDDSFSMQAKSENGTLLENAVQTLLNTVPKDQKISIFTNTKTFKTTTITEVQNELIALPHSPQQMRLSDIFRKGNSIFKEGENSVKRMVVISDFQSNMGNTVSDTTDAVLKYLVQLHPFNIGNSSVDSVYIRGGSGQSMDIVALISCNTDLQSAPVSLYDNDRLIAKTGAVFDGDKKAQVTFSLPANEIINGKIEISDNGLSYDNRLFFNINAKDKIKVLVVGEENSNYLGRIFTDDEFTLSSFAPTNLNYALIESQNLVILNELSTITAPLLNALEPFYGNGGSLVVIPSDASDVVSYNRLLRSLHGTSFLEKTDSGKKITNIAFSHPLYQNVFEKTITNFEYPSAASYYLLKTIASPILSFENKDPFLLGSAGAYIFSSAISSESSNFKNSPLIVPTLYNMGLGSLRLPALYHTIGETTVLDIPVSLGKDQILKISGADLEFIPLQQSYSNKVRLTLFDNPSKAGIYGITNGDETLKNTSFNYPRTESDLTYLDLGGTGTVYDSVASLFEDLEKESSSTQLWKWFVILALLFMLIEILIVKTFT